MKGQHFRDRWRIRRKLVTYTAKTCWWGKQ